MRKTMHVQRRFDTEHRILDRIAKLLPVGQPKPWSYPAVAEEIGEPAHAVLLAKRTMEDAGILRTHLEYPKGQSGRLSVWELRMPLPLAHEEMRKEHERQLERPSRKVQRRGRRLQAGEPTTLQPAKLVTAEEGRALLRETREYVGRADWARRHIEEMKAAGIEVDSDAVTVRRDERLETIAMVLPAIDELIRENERLADQVDRWLGGKAGRDDGADVVGAYHLP